MPSLCFVHIESADANNLTGAEGALTVNNRLPTHPVLSCQPRVLLDPVRAGTPDQLVQLESLGYYFGVRSQRQDGGEGCGVFDCLGAALCLVFGVGSVW